MGKIIVIDCGHGLNTPGKRCMKAIDPAETREWFISDGIGDIIQNILSMYDCTVLRADDTTGVKDIPLSRRVATANAANANLYISIHQNAGIAGGVGGGTVVFYNSDNYAADAKTLHDTFVKNTGLNGNRSQKTIKNGFYVIRKTNMEAFLIECGFMDSRTDTPVILSPSFKGLAANAIAEFIIVNQGLQLKSVMPKDPSASASSEFYPAYTGKPTTLVGALVALGIPSAFTNRSAYAKANGIVGYVGTAAQNTQLYNLLKAGLLKKG